MKTLKNDRYTYRVTWSEDDEEYVGLCAEFPSLSWLASSQLAALNGIRSVVADVVADMKKGREPGPCVTRAHCGYVKYHVMEGRVGHGNVAFALACD